MADTMSGMSLIGVLVFLIIVGVLLWAVNSAIPMQPQIKSILNIVVVLFVVLYLLRGFGLLTHVGF